MKSSRGLFCSVMISLALVMGPMTALAGTFRDNFNDNSLASSWWTVTTTGAATLAETNQRLEIGITQNLTSTGLMTLNMPASGDFDARVDYELLSWPAINDVRVVLQETLDASSGIASVTRFNHYVNNGDYYVTNFNNALYPSPWISTTDLTGTLRFTRMGQVFSGYYGVPGDDENWNLIYSFDDPGNLRSTPVEFGLGTYKGLPGGTQVAFDNFRITGDGVVPEPLSTILFLAGGSTMAAALIRKRRIKV
jgi:hypothetical protein